jgi:hypothetical protein
LSVHLVTHNTIHRSVATSNSQSNSSRTRSPQLRTAIYTRTHSHEPTAAHRYLHTHPQPRGGYCSGKAGCAEARWRTAASLMLLSHKHERSGDANDRTAFRVLCYVGERVWPHRQTDTHTRRDKPRRRRRARLTQATLPVLGVARNNFCVTSVPSARVERAGS